MYTFSAVIAAIFAWVLGFAYQRFRFFVLEREDARQLERAERGGCSQEWLASVSSQAAIGLVNPNTIEALVGLGLIERPAMAGRLATYNPSFVLSLVSWLPLFVLAALAFVAHNLLAIASFGVSSSPWLLMFNLSLVAIAMADARFRIIPIPFLLVLVAAGLLAFGMDDALFYIMTILCVSAV